MAQPREFGHQRLEIVDLTVVDDADCPALPLLAEGGDLLGLG